jgi:hypothetical protein
MNFERGKDIKSAVGIGIEETYNPLKIGSSFKLRCSLKGREWPPAQSLFGSERGHQVLKVLEDEHPDRQKLQELTFFKNPIMELLEIRFYYSPGDYQPEVDLPYDLGYVYDVDHWMREVALKHGDLSQLPFRTEKTSELPVMFDGQLYFIRVIDVF